MKIACVGAGPAGLYLAILLKRLDSDREVTVFEQNSAGITQGWGVVFWEDLLEDLRNNDSETAGRIRDQSFHWVGQVLDIAGREPLLGGGGGFSMRRRRLLEILSDRAASLGVNIEFNHRIARVEQLRDADVIVASDGVGSQLRQSHAEIFKPKVVEGRNKYIWLGTTRVFGSFTFGFVSTKAGWIWFHAYGFDQETSTFIAECSSETWTALGFDGLGAADGLALLERIFGQHLDGHRLFSHALAVERLPWLNFRTLTNERWHVGKLVLVGDAAHTTHFSIGSGTRLAIQDAIALAGYLHTHSNVTTAFDAYQRERQLALIQPQKEASLSAQWFESVPRYVELEPSQFARLLLGRRSPLLPYMSPRMYCRLDTITKQLPVFRTLRRWAAEFYRRQMQA